MGKVSRISTLPRIDFENINDCLLGWSHAEWMRSQQRAGGHMYVLPRKVPTYLGRQGK